MMDINTTFGYWVRVAPFAGYEIQKYSRPAFVGKHETPETLDNITIGQLIELSSLQDDTALYKIPEIVLGIKAQELETLRAVEVVRFIGWVISETERINKLFAETNVKPTEQEQKAGISRLQFGLFGMVDWYAQRMGISDHEQVMQVPWLRIYKCLDMDSKKTLYERKLQEVINDEYRRKSKSNRARR